MRHWPGVLVIAALSGSCVHHSLFHADRKALQKADTVQQLQPIARNSLEWWYFNGHLHDSSGREYAFHTALFRRYTFPFRSIWMSNTALADLANDTVIRHYHFYRSREFRIATKAIPDIEGPAIGFSLQSRTWQLRAKEASFGLELLGESGTAPVAMAPNAVMHCGKQQVGYLSMPWLDWRGKLRMGDSSVYVSGIGWFDRQWSALKLTGRRYSWNWISLGHDSFRLMVFGIRDDRRDTNYLHAAEVGPNGAVRYYTAESWMLHGSEPLDKVTGGKEFPQIWQLCIPGMDLKVCMKACIADAVMTLRAFRWPFMTYWEGPAEAWGLYRGEPFRSHAYIELTRH
jgi:predicted secreted hydrolase